MSTRVRQMSYDHVCALLCGALLDGVQAGPGAAEGIGSVQGRASATLYGLLIDHPIDRQGRCRSCRHPGVFGRRRRCRVHVKACHWLHHPGIQFLLSPLASEFGLASTGAAATDPEDTDVLSATATDPPTQPLQTPAVPPPLPPCRFPRAGRPDPNHRGAGDDLMACGLAVFHPRTHDRLIRVGRRCSPEA